MAHKKEWHLFKIFGISLLSFIAGGFLLQFLCNIFKLNLSAGFIATFLFIHVLIIIVIYEIFRRSLRGTLTRQAIQTRFNRALFIALLSNFAILFLLYAIVGMNSFLLLSPVLLNLILFISLRTSIPQTIRKNMKLRWDNVSHYKSTFDDTDQIITDMSHPANPNGFFNPGSPNYIHRQ